MGSGESLLDTCSLNKLKKLGDNLRVSIAPTQIRTGVLALSPLHGDERVENKKSALIDGEYAPTQIRTGVLALSPLHGDERAENKKSALIDGEYAPTQIRTGVLALSPLHGDERAENKKSALIDGEYAPTQIRTGVLALKGLRPGPLDDGGGFQADGFYHPNRLRSRITGQICRCQVKYPA
jgi:hypothetical protein